MNKTLRQIIMIKASIATNTFLYFLKRLWVIGKRIPDSIYGNQELKLILGVLFTVVGQIMCLVRILLYIMLMIVLPAIMAQSETGKRFDYLVQSIFFLSCIIGPLQDSVIFSVTKVKVICIRYMKMDVKRYTKAAFVYHYIPFFVFFLIGILGATKLLNGSLVKGFGIWIIILMMRAAGEAFQLWLFDRKGIVFSRKNTLVWTVITLSVIGAYSFFWVKKPFLTSGILLHPAVLVFITMVGVFSLWYIMKAYEGYDIKVYQTVEESMMLSSIIKQSGQASVEKNVETREQDIRTNEKTMKKIETMHGYQYFNALFFLRHRRQILRPVYYRLAAVGIFFLGGVALKIFAPDIARLLGEGIPDSLPILVFVMYMMTVADKACKAMFYNCDKSMLKFGFYRNPKILLSNFQIRLKKIIEYDLIIGIAICVSVIAYRFICGIAKIEGNLILFCVAVLVLSVFFSVHHLFLYYVFQPYSEEMNVKNPFFTVMNIVVYFICFACYQIRTGGILFIAGVLIVTVVYIIVALLLVYRYAPKMFRVK